MTYGKKKSAWRVMQSEEMVGERIEQADREQGSHHVILSGAKDLRAAPRGSPSSGWMLTHLLGAHFLSRWAMAVGGAQILRSTQDDMVAASSSQDKRVRQPSLHSA